jgi:hypothetical protein
VWDNKSSMGKFETDQDLARSKYIIIASVAAIAMVLGAMSVGAMYRKNPAGGKNPILSQIYPIPVNDTDDGSSSGKKSTPERITPSFSKEQSIPLDAHPDWGKKALLTDPINLQVRVGLTQTGVQVNALGLTVGLPANDVLQGVSGILDEVGNGPVVPTPNENSGADSNTGSNADQTPPVNTDQQTPPNNEQASTLSASNELITP